MGIEYKLWERHQFGKPDLWCPFFICDICHEPIILYGNVEYKVTIDSHKSISPLYFVHKKHSHTLRKIMPELNNELWYWQEISVFLKSLFINFLDNEMETNIPLAMYLNIFGFELSSFIDINCQDLRNPGIYFLFDNDELIYIGQSQNIFNRLNYNHHIYRDYHKIRYSVIYEKDKRDFIESGLIKLCLPDLNIDFTKWGFDA